MKGRRALLYIITGISLALAFPPFNVYTLYFAGIALLIHIVHSSNKFKEVFIRTYFAFLTFEAVTVSWIGLSGLREDADKFMILGGFITIIIHSGLLTLPLIIYFYSRKSLTKYFGKAAIFALPFIWVTVEYFYALPEVSFPWVTAGNAFTTALHKIQFIEYTGVYGISFWAMTLSCILYLMFEKASERKDTILSLFRKKSFNTLLAVFIVIYFIPDVFTLATGAASYQKNYSEGNIKVSIIQPNINPWKKWGSEQMKLVNDYVEMLQAADSISVKPELTILPETAVPFFLLNDYYTDKYYLIKNVVDRSGIPLLIGTPDLVYYNDSLNSRPDSRENKTTGQKYDTYNSAVLMQPREERASHQKYAKNKLVIASERMPYQERISFLRDIIRWSVGISSFQVGLDTTVFALGSKAKFGTAICYESIYPEYFSSFARKGAEFYVIITNDGWWGKLFGTYQHNRFAVLRAIENRRWIARCANTGISCFIDAYGNMYEETPINEKMIINGSIGLSGIMTFYTKNPNLFPGIISVIAGLIIAVSILGVIQGRNNKKG